MKNLKLYSILFIALAIFSSCEDEVEAPGTNYASFESYLGDITVSPGQDYTKSINIYTANIIGESRTIELTLTGSLDAASYEAPTSVTIPANSNVGSIDLIFKDVNLDIIQDKTLTIAMNGTAALSVGENITLNVAKGCPTGEGKLKISVEMDPYPEEVYWRVIDLTAGVIVLSNNDTPGFGGYADGTEATQKDGMCLPAGDYLFQVYDAYSDGAGAITITIDGVQVYSTDGAYGGGDEKTFTIN